MQNEIVTQVPIRLIACGPNVRTNFSEDSAEALCKSVQKHGIQVPLILERRADGRLHLIDGARRLMASKLAKLETVPCLVQDGETADVERVERQFVINCQREDLTPMEKARALNAIMKEAGLTATQAAERVGFSNATVTRLVSLLSLPEAMQAEVDAGTLPASSAYQLARIADPVERADRAAAVAAGQMTRDELAGAGKAARRPRAQGEAREPVSRVTAKLSAERTITVAAPALDLDTFIALLTELLGRARQARTQGLALETLRKVLSDQASIQK